jgi:hypothetical protein
MAEPVFMKLGMYIMGPEPISTAYSIHSSHHSACLYGYPLIIVRQRLGKNPLIVARQRLGKNPLIVARQRLGRNVTAATNIHAIEEMYVSFSMRSVSYQGRKAISSSQNFLFSICDLLLRLSYEYHLFPAIPISCSSTSLENHLMSSHSNRF